MRGYCDSGLATLQQHRDGRGRWTRFPFWYTLLAVSELDGRAALAEMHYAAPLLERHVSRAVRADVYSQRRHILAERVLAKC